MIHFIQPYDYDINIGKAYNDTIERLDDWICITDQDTLKFDGFAQRVRDIVKVADKKMVITCMTNRLRRDNENVIMEMYNESDINMHIQMYHRLWTKYGTELQRTRMPIAGVCMIFHKSVWDVVKFRENDPTFDGIFTTDIKRAGFTPCVAKGLYIFHLYRWEKNVADTSHLYPGAY